MYKKSTLHHVRKGFKVDKSNHRGIKVRKSKKHARMMKANLLYKYKWGVNSQMYVFINELNSRPSGLDYGS